MWNNLWFENQYNNAKQQCIIYVLQKSLILYLTLCIGIGIYDKSIYT